MTERLVRTTLLFVIVIACHHGVAAQAADASSSSPFQRPREEPPQPVLEQMARLKLENEKRDFQELIDTSSTLADSAKSLLELSGTGRPLQEILDKNLDRIERLTKKIRSELGAGDDSKEPTEYPDSLKDALKALSSEASALSEEIKKSSRFSISVAAIQHANTLLDLVSHIRRNN